MATTLDIITRALRLVKVVAGDETPEADDASNALNVLNNMMFSWKANGVDTTHTTLALATTFPLNNEYIKPTTYLLADELAGEYGVTPPDQSKVRNSWDVLRAAYFTAPTATVDAGLTCMPSQFNHGNFRSNANS